MYALEEAASRTAHCLEKLVAETKAELNELASVIQKELVRTKTETISWMCGLWVGQIAVYVILFWFLAR